MCEGVYRDEDKDDERESDGKISATHEWRGRRERERRHEMKNTAAVT